MRTQGCHLFWALTEGRSRDGRGWKRAYQSHWLQLAARSTYVGGYAIWLLLSIQSAPIVLVHTLGLLTGAVTFGVALRLRGPLS